MKSMPNIKLTEKEVQQLLMMNKITSGGEATICESDNPYTLYKIFSKCGVSLPMGENKEKKIIELYNRGIYYSVRPISTISMNGTIIGYEMTNEYDLDNYELYQLSKDELIFFLRKTKDILEYFSSEEIIYGDLDTRNILFNRMTGEIKFCDMDNVQIDDYEMDVKPYSLLEYESKHGIDSGVHPYMHNLMTLRSINLDLLCSSKSDFRRSFKRVGRTIIKSMEDPKEFKEDYIIKYIKKI